MIFSLVGETRANKDSEVTESIEKEANKEPLALTIDSSPDPIGNEQNLDLQAESMCIVCNKENAMKPSSYCSEGCIYFTILTDANEHRLLTRKSSNSESFVSAAGLSEDANNVENGVGKAEVL